ncbi:MAG: fumarate hydratase [Metallosphaera sp.]
MGVHVEIGETHISSLPVAVNVQCWRGERATAEVTLDMKVNMGD